MAIIQDIMNIVPSWKTHTDESGYLKAPGQKDYHQKAGYNFYENFPNTPTYVADALAKGYQYGTEGIGSFFNEGTFSDAMARAKEEARLNSLGFRGKGFDMDEYNQTMNFARTGDTSGLTYGSAQAGEPNKIKAMRQDLKSIPNHIRRQTSFPTNKQTAPRSLGFDTSYGVANEADVAQKPLTQEKGNIFQQGWQRAKDFKTSIGEGITGILDNTMIGRIAAMNNALNPRAFNYNPALQGQIDFMKNQGMYGTDWDQSGLNKITGGVLAGKNLQSMFGLNDLGKLYDKSIARTQKTIDNFGKKWSRLKKDDPDEYYKKLAFHQNKLKQKIREKKLAGIAASKDLEKRKTASRDNWQSQPIYSSPSGRDHKATAGIGSKESKKGPAGGSIGASRFLARGGRASYFNGGLASLWPR